MVLGRHSGDVLGDIRRRVPHASPLVNKAAQQVKNAALGYVNGNGGIMSEQASLVLERRS